MTDTRLPEQWLGDIVLDELSDGAYRVHVNGLMWSVKYGKDGVVAAKALRLLHPEGPRQDLAEELVRSGLWASAENGWKIHDFLRFQTSAAQREADMERKRTNQQAYRDRLNGKVSDAAPTPPRTPVTGNGTGNVTDHVARHVGEARAGQERVSALEVTISETPAATRTQGARSSAPRSSLGASTSSWPEVRSCAHCASPMDPALWAGGERSHPTCVPGQVAS